jgi:hypothetical protein
LINAANTLFGSESVCRALEREIEAYRSFDYDFGRTVSLAECHAEELGVHPYRARYIYLTSLAPFALPYFERVGLGREEWYDSMMDFKWNGALCYSKYGIFGNYSEWSKRFLAADRIAFGRLQYNEFEARATHKSDKFDLKPESFVITVHIPSDTRTPFSPENRLKSYKRASDFYKNRFEDGRVIFRCGSWLLNPIHKTILPEGSNIRSFVDEYELCMDSLVESFDDLPRIFDVWNFDGNVASLPEDSSLRRAYKKHLLSGGKMGVVTGFRLGDI